MGRTKLFLTNQPQLIDVPSKGFWSIMLYNCICPFHCFVFYHQFCCSRLNWNARSSVQNCLNPLTPYNINCVYSLIQLLGISTIVFLHILEWMKLSFLVNMAHTSTNYACFCCGQLKSADTKFSVLTYTPYQDRISWGIIWQPSELLMSSSNRPICSWRKQRPWSG